MQTKSIAQYVLDDRIDAFVVVRKAEVREFTRGQYVRMELGDASGRIDGVMWEPDQWTLTELSAGQVVKVRGQVTEYQGKQQLTVQRIRRAESDEFEIREVLQHSQYTRDELAARVRKLTSEVQNTYIRQLLDSFWDDEELFEKYLTTPAAKLWHHAFIGGLAEHSLSLTELCLRAGAGYNWLNRDYLIFGGLMHDIGKIDTYTRDFVIDFTDEGRLVGHICLADHWITSRAEAIVAFPPTLLTKLRHLVLAHQGFLHQASPVEPMLPEAFLLYYCDEIDAKLGAIERLRGRQAEPGWTDWIKLIERYLYLESVDKPEQSAG